MKYLLLVLILFTISFTETSIECMDRVLGSHDLWARVAVKDYLKKEYGPYYRKHYSVHLKVTYPWVKDSCWVYKKDALDTLLH